jgi:hypothetical protein
MRKISIDGQNGEEMVVVKKETGGKGLNGNAV